MSIINNELSFYNFEVKTIEGQTTTLSRYQGKTLLIVNVASHCGFTNQYAGLQKLYDTYKHRNFMVLGFPCNQFGNQEPGTEAEIKNFCETQYNVTFPLFAKIDVNGPQAHPLFNFLQQQARGILGSTSIKWNFTKFLVDKDGNVIQRLAPNAFPEDIEKEIIAALDKAGA